MLDFGRIFKNKYTKYIISIILGLGLSSLFRESCKDRDCYNFVAPKMEDLQSIQKDVYEFDDTCYVYEKQATKCNKKTKKILTIEDEDVV